LPKILLTIFFAILVFGEVFAQEQANIWYFGSYAGLDFTSGNPVALTNGALSTGEGCATICDNSGHLLFYSDGITIWNRNHTKMPNGTGLFGHPSSTQSCIFVPKPASNTLYYVFTVDAMAGIHGLEYSIVDISADGGLGDVVSKNNLLITPTCEKLTSVQHANGVDFWIIAHDWNSDVFESFLLTAGGVQLPSVKSHSGISNNGNTTNSIGYLTASPNGIKLASVLFNQGLGTQGSVQVFDFNSNTGKITYFNTLNYPGSHPYGVSFSPDNSKLYVGIFSGAKGIFQYDLSSQDTIKIISSEYFIPYQNSFGALQLGPDGKIYIAILSSKSLSVINDPDKSGALCNYNDLSINLGGKLSNLGLPDLVESYFSVLPFSYIANCIGTNSTFTLTNAGAADSVKWNFGDSLSKQNASVAVSASHIYLQAGSYTVSLTSYKKGMPYIYKSLVLIPSPPYLDSTHKVIGICRGGSQTVDFSQKGCSYLWSDSSVLPKYTFKDTGTYWLKISNANCSITDTIKVDYLPVPYAQFKSRTICIGDTLKLDATHPGYTYLWKDGSTSPKYDITKPGDYSLTVSNGSCTYEDDFNVDFVRKPDASYNFKDTFICPGKLLIIDITDDVDGYLTYLWQDGSISPKYIIRQPGHYWVKTNSDACSVTDSFIVKQANGLNPVSWKDTSLCAGESFTLDATQPGVHFLWQDGSQTPTYHVSNEGEYTLKRYNQCDTTNDSIRVKYFTKPILPPWHDTILCKRQNLVLHINSYKANPVWQDGSNDSTYYIHDPGIYKVAVSNICGTASDSIKVGFQDCPFYLYIPNAFTPGNDHHNDIFMPVMDYAPTTYLFSVYNRWGEKLFETIDYKLGWDGKFRNISAPEGAYIYYLYVFSYLDDRYFQKSGMFYLLKPEP